MNEKGGVGKSATATTQPTCRHPGVNSNVFWNSIKNCCLSILKSGSGNDIIKTNRKIYREVRLWRKYMP
jgi:hypothetical protein